MSRPVTNRHGYPVCPRCLVPVRVDDARRSLRARCWVAVGVWISLAATILGRLLS